MTTADYALVASLASILISIGALLWNVWQKFLFVKPTLQVSFGMGRVFNTSEGVTTPSGQRLLNLTVTNMGPGPVILQCCIAKERKNWWQRRKSYPTINPIHGDPTDPNPIGIGPYGGGLPGKIDTGEVRQFYFPYGKECFLKRE